MTMSMTLSPGDIVAERYRLESKLGEGGMGAVWAATHAVTGKRVAIKFLKAELAGDAGLVGRFIREARAACSVRHPNVVPIHDVLQLPSGVPIMVMDLLDGESLGDRLSRAGPLSVPELARIMLPVISAIAAAHAASVVHRDLKPDNLFLVPVANGKVDARVLDFGIAKVAATDEKIDPLTKTGAMMGTPYYMSPEQLFGEKDVDYRTDIWALGIIFYECLSGRRPTEADNLGQIIKLVTVTGIPPLVSVVPNVPADISQLVEGMLTNRRERRPALHDVEAILTRHATAPASGESEAPPHRIVITPEHQTTPANTADSWAATHATQSTSLTRRWRYPFAALAVLVFGTGGLLVRHYTRAPNQPAAGMVVPVTSIPSAESIAVPPPVTASLSVATPSASSSSEKAPRKLPVRAGASTTASAPSTPAASASSPRVKPASSSPLEETVPF